jgi:ATP phosphoribosyltransferase regulatory subunit
MKTREDEKEDDFFGAGGDELDKILESFESALPEGVPKSLEEISGDFVLDISHLGIISALIDGMVSDRDAKEKLIVALGEKNIHTIDALCKENSVDAGKADMLRALVSMKGDCCEMLSILDGSNVFSEARELADIVNILKETYGDKVRIDFSVVDDMRYYNGIIFKGFVKGIPSSLLSGGRYDKLMERMGKKSGAVGFAIYLDLLDELELDEIKTKKFQAVLDNLKVNKAMVVLNENDKNVVMSAKNIPNVITAQTNTINVYDILKYNTMIVTKAAVETIQEVYA